MVRAFISVDIPSEIKAELRFIVGELTTQIEGARIRWVKSDNMHLTLKFLGEIQIDLVQSILGAVRKSVVHIDPFHVTLSQVESFPPCKWPRVISFGVEGDLQMLGALQENIENELKVLGLPKERRSFRPHVTLGRVRGGYIHQALDFSWVALWQNMRWHIPHLKWLVNDVHLIRSVLTSSGVVYTKLESISLQ